MPCHLIVLTCFRSFECGGEQLETILIKRKGKRSVSQRSGGEWTKKIWGCEVAQTAIKRAAVDFIACMFVFQFVRDQRPNSSEDSAAWRSTFIPQSWSTEVCVCVSEDCTYTVTHHLPVLACPISLHLCVQCFLLRNLFASHPPVSGSARICYIKQCFASTSCLHLVFHVYTKQLPEHDVHY